MKDVPETEAVTRYQENANARMVCMARPVRSPAALAVLETEAAMRSLETALPADLGLQAAAASCARSHPGGFTQTAVVGLMDVM